MTKLLASLLILLGLSSPCLSQTYLSLNPSLSNEAGTLADKSNLAIEIGRQWDVFSLGLIVGKNSLAKPVGKDTTTYIEIRPNLNVFQQGKFTNTFTAGIGYIFNAQENLLTEVTSGIEYAFKPQIHFNIVFGQYYYSGRYSSSNSTFFGLSCMYFFAPVHAQSLIKNGNQN